MGNFKFQRLYYLIITHSKGPTYFVEIGEDDVFEATHSSKQTIVKRKN